MKNKLTDWAKRKYNRSSSPFLPAEIRESTEELHNPACGMYQMYTLAVEQEPDLEELHWCMDNSLVLVFFQIGHYRKIPLDETAIRHMDDVLAELSRAQKDVILRIAYDNTGKGLEQEPETFDRILEHMEHLAPLLHKYTSCIYILQGLFVGSWGEMHTSRYLSADKLVRLEKKLRQCIGAETYLAFRRPVHYRKIHKMTAPEFGTGIFDDGILGSSENLGTFGTQSQKKVGWEQPWSREEELQFLTELSRYAPIGGEAVLGDNPIYPYTLPDTIDLLTRMHLSYLNSAYDSRVHRAWEKMTYHQRGAWNGINGKEYIIRHIGYRYRVTEVRCSPEGEALHLSITIRNDGFSRAYRAIHPYIRTGEERSYIEYDLQNLLPQQQCTLHVRVASGSGEILLGASWMPDRREVRFANRGIAGGQILLGRGAEIGGKSGLPTEG